MCGIFFSSQHEHSVLLEKHTTQLLKQRGPDSFCVIQRAAMLDTVLPSIDHVRRANHLMFASSVLSLRGCGVVSQPVVDDNSSSVFCWNGEAWKAKGEDIHGSDSLAISEMLFLSLQNSSKHLDHLGAFTSYERTLQAILCDLSSISGPYAFVFYDAIFQRVFFGRDVLGRRSLVIRKQASHGITISSVCDGSSSLGKWTEVEADGVYMLKLTTNSTSSSDAVLIGHTNEGDPFVVEHFPWASPTAEKSLNGSMISPFSELNRRTPDAGVLPLQLESKAVYDLKQQLSSSLALRVKDVPPPPTGVGSKSRIAILFSGGLDCTLIARALHDIIPQDQGIDLLNVAFQNPRVVAAAAKQAPDQIDTNNPVEQAYALCPDRITGLSSYAELLSVCPGREWRFVFINIPYTETVLHRAQIISLIYPHSTEMDFSIGCALYFAARGIGHIQDPFIKSPKPYTTPARVLLSGLGADELFAGYTRHATAFTRRGYLGLIDEIELDFFRLGKRNLGRDDRVISHWGREARYPFLDEQLVSWALELPIWEKCGFGTPRSTLKIDKEEPQLEPGKHVLRLLAWKLGIKSAAQEKKRAIQFGARTAKMQTGRTKGTQLLSS